MTTTHLLNKKRIFLLGITILFLIGGGGSIAFSQDIAQDIIGESVQEKAQSGMYSWEKPEKMGKWYRLTAGHYVIWYEEKDRAVAKELARVGDAMYEDYKDFFGDANPKKVYIQIQSRTGYANGSYGSSPPIINFYTAALPSDTKGYDWNYFLLTHEFLHYMQIEYRLGLSGVAAVLFGPMGRTVLSLSTPFWVYEGFATKMESDYTSSGRLHHPLFTMPYRADVLLNNVDTYLEITRTHADDETVNFGRRYQYGVQFSSYLVDTYGYEAMAKAWQKFMWFPLGYRSRLKNTMRASEGNALPDNFSVLYNGMIENSQKEYEVFKDWKRGKELKRFENNRAKYVVVKSSEKGVLIHQSGTDVVGQYMLYTPATQKLKKLFVMNLPALDFYNNQPADITRDGEKMVYVKRLINNDMLDRNGKSIGVYNDLFLYDTQTKKHKRLTKKQQLTTPVMSDDKKYVYASQYRGSGGKSRLIRISTEDAKQGYEVIYEGTNSLVFYKTLSPDGKRIAFVERSAEFGVKLQLLELETGTLTTLIEREYGLWIASPKFTYNNRISIVADLEYTTDNTMMYEIDISSIENIVWKRVGRDKIGFQSAVLDEDSRLVYSSHNSKGYSIYSYEKNDLENEIISLDTIPLPSFYTDNNMQKKLNINVLRGSEVVKERRLPYKADELQYKERRALSVIPYRVRYYAPTFTTDTIVGSALGLAFSSMGPTQRSVFVGNAGYLFNLNEGVYDISYTYRFPRIGSIEVKSEKKLTGHSINTAVSYIKQQYSQRVKYSRILLYTNTNFYIGVNMQASLDHVSYISSLLVFAQEGFYSTYAVTLPIGWKRQGTQDYKLSNDFKWKITPSFVYIPDILDQKAKVEKLSVNSSFHMPIVRRLGIKFSNNTVWSNNSRYNASTERLYQISRSSALYYPKFTKKSKIIATNIGVQTPIKSSFAIDILLPLSNIRMGGHVFEPYRFYVNIFGEQTVGYNVDYADKIEYNKYLISGVETGLNIAVFSIPFAVNFGTAYRIPYDSDTSSDVYVYFSVSPSISSINGATIQ